jgi:hypothetical protein
MHTHIIYRKELFVKGIAYVIVCLLLEIVFLYVVKSRTVCIILLIAMVLPLPFMSLLLNAFTRETDVELNHDYFNFGITDKGNKLEKRIDLTELEYYSIQFPNNKFISVRFWLRSGKANEFSFFREKREGDINTNELIESLRSSIRTFNSRPGIAKKIALRPSFYASNGGLYSIVALSLFFLAGIILASFYREKSVPVTFVFSLILIVQMILKRKKDLQYYKHTNVEIETHAE